MLAEEKEEVLVFKERGSSVLHRAAFPAAFRQLAKSLHCLNAKTSSLLS